jgi:DNA-binding protein Fis
LEEVGNQVVIEAMRRAKGNQTLAAKMIGITRQGLAKRLKMFQRAVV